MGKLSGSSKINVGIELNENGNKQIKEHLNLKLIKPKQTRKNSYGFATNITYVSSATLYSGLRSQLTVDSNHSGTYRLRTHYRTDDNYGLLPSILRGWKTLFPIHPLVSDVKVLSQRCMQKQIPS